MDSESPKALNRPTCEYLAQTWLQQQELRGKSATEIADMYVSALIQIEEKYAPPPQQPTGRRIRSSGIKPDEW